MINLDFAEFVTNNGLRIPGNNSAGDSIETYLNTYLPLRIFRLGKTPLYWSEVGYPNCTNEEFLEKLGLNLPLFFANESCEHYLDGDRNILVTLPAPEEEKSPRQAVSIDAPLDAPLTGMSLFRKSSIVINILCQDREVLEKFKEVCKECIDEELKEKEDIRYINILTMNMQGGVSTTSIRVPTMHLVGGNYSTETLEKYKYSIEDLKSLDPKGHLHIFTGPPGSGKTYMIRGLIADLEDESNIIILPANMVSSLDGPSLLTTLVTFREYNDGPIVLIIEDADACLVERMSDNIGTISTLLNSADGIIGSVLDLRIVATTNQEKLKFDKALVRPGRLTQILDVGELTASHSNEIYKRLTETDDEPYEQPQILSDIYSDAVGAKYKKQFRREKRIVGFG